MLNILSTKIIGELEFQDKFLSSPKSTIGINELLLKLMLTTKIDAKGETGIMCSTHCELLTSCWQLVKNSMLILIPLN